MSEQRAALKTELLGLVDKTQGGFKSDEPWVPRIQELVDEIPAQSLYPEPMDRLDKVDGRWRSLFASFGVAHSQGLGIKHASDLKLHSFNNLPPAEIEVTCIDQEIDSATGAYNNVVEFEPKGGGPKGRVIVFGKFSEDEENRQRFHVNFYAVKVIPANGGSLDDLRQALGLDEGTALEKDLKKSPRLHSDIVYLDDDTRINVGSMGGSYVMTKVDEPLASVD